jgi:hypothetical protein
VLRLDTSLGSSQKKGLKAMMTETLDQV